MNYKKYMAGLLACIALTSCSDFLDETPDQRTIINTPDKAKDLLVFAYPSANSFWMMEMMSDNVDDSGKTENTKRDALEYYTWEDETSEAIDSPAEFWESSYQAISQANHAIASIESMDAPQAKKNEILGEAFLARAYNHWMLATLFCEAYDPATAAATLGIPYNTLPETTLSPQYERGTLADVYELIEQDVENGLAIVTNNYKNPGFHFTKDAGLAFAARFYANKGDWDKVMEVTNSLGDFPEGKLRKYNELIGTPDDAQGQKFGSPSMSTNLLITGSRTLIARVVLMSRFGATNAILGQRVDQTFNPFNKRYVYDPSGYTSYQIFGYKKFYEYFVYSNAGAGIGQPYVNIPLLTYDEAYLFRIEATIMAGNYDKAAKMMGFFAKFRTVGYEAGNNENSVTTQALLNKVRNADEYQPYYDLDVTQRKLVKFLAEMRRSEFYHLGNRWYDIKRFNLPVSHKLKDEGTIVLEPRDLRKAVQLPQSALSAKLTPNPR